MPKPRPHESHTSRPRPTSRTQRSPYAHQATAHPQNFGCGTALRSGSVSLHPNDRTVERRSTAVHAAACCGGAGGSIPRSLGQGDGLVPRTSPRHGPRAARQQSASSVQFIPHGGRPMAAGPVSRLGSFEPGDKTGLRLSKCPTGTPVACLELVELLWREGCCLWPRLAIDGQFSLCGRTRGGRDGA